MTTKQGAAGRGDGQAASENVLLRRKNNTSASTVALHKLPPVLRSRYVRACLATDRARRLLVKVHQLLETTQP
jgi:hypothetical protein